MGAKCLRSVRSVHFIPRNLPALTRSDLANSVRLRLGSVNRVSNCLGGAEERFYVPSSGNPSPPARGLSPGWRDDALCSLCLPACPGCGVYRSDANAVQNRLKQFFKVQFAWLISASSFSSARSTATNASVQTFSSIHSVHSVHGLFQP